ncbi:FMN-binding negative transcriptional regulator [Enterovirga rhinocerotis]|uniref:PaiB family negative transcriptional regulator n=1 Tax=Enterovirga rhinocerotis TaxID=1339210 RepID=A0A4R7C7B2_9HYPH|nr:FMN-binding negative transcriptional regulator [Enterovirga rhinocerotis]TDR94520.1 PaiB family negative transcriptional regulator [Enterovirga rhinocerotis]
MHILRPAFAMTDDEALAFAAQRGFGTLIASDEDGPRGSHVPFVVERREGGETVVQTHLTARNPLAALADGRRRFLLVVAGPDAYVSNDWYDTPDQVSTWLYRAVHLSGVAHRREFDGNRPHGDSLLAATEERLLPKEPWTLAGMEPVKREGMLRAITVVDLHVDRIEGQNKLNQHKPDVDHVAIADRLGASDATPARELAEAMRALRPGLSYRSADT